MPVLLFTSFSPTAGKPPVTGTACHRSRARANGRRGTGTPTGSYRHWGLYDDYDLTAEQVARLRHKGLIRFDPDLTQITLLPDEEEGEDTNTPLPIAAIYTPKNGAYSDNEDDPETFLTTLLKESLAD